MKTVNCYLSLLYFLFFVNFSYSANQTIGSSFAVGPAQNTITFDGVNNTILNYALMDGGFNFSDSLTTCSWYSIFPVKNLINLSGGKLFLFRDFNIASNTCFFSDGFIQGDSAIVQPYPKTAIRFSPEVKNFQDPRVQIDFLSEINSVNWSFDDNYLVVGTDNAANSSFRIYSFDGQAAIFSSSYVNTLPDIFSVAARPPGLYSGLYHFCMGQVAGGPGFYELRTVSLDSNTNVLGLLGGKIEDPNSCRAFAWSSDGDYLVYGVDNSTIKILDVPFDGNIIGSTEVVPSGGASIATSFAPDSLSWSPSNLNLAAAFDDKLEIYFFGGGTSFSFTTSFGLGRLAEHASWHPELDFIAVGLEGGSESFRLFEFSQTDSTLTEILSSRIGETDSVLALDWCSDGKRLAIATDNSSGKNLKVYKFNASAKMLVLERVLGCDYNINTVRWSNNGKYLAWGGDGNVVDIINLDDVKSLKFKDVFLVFNGDFNLTVPIIFEGNCFLSSNYNSFNIIDGGRINVTSGSTLIFQNTYLDGLCSNNLSSLADTSRISFIDSRINIVGDYEFGFGSLDFISDNVITGTSIFKYSSTQAFNIEFDSLLGLVRGLKFYYAPKSDDKDLIVFKDKSSTIFLNESSLFTTNTGLRLINGTVIVDNNVTFSSSGKALSEGIVFGDGIFGNNLNINFLADANLQIYGPFSYENTF
jgi:hypothetical protein